MLSAIFVQDLKSRSVYWFWFPLLILLFVILLISKKTVTEVLHTSLLNCVFLGFQLLLVSIYFSIRHRSIINITKDLLGWGDVLFLLSISFYLSALNYILFYVVSLIIVLLLWMVVVLLFKKKRQQIPLAGLQSIIFIVCLLFDWSNNKIDLTRDEWLIHYLYK